MKVERVTGGSADTGEMTEAAVGPPDTVDEYEVAATVALAVADGCDAWAQARGIALPCGADYQSRFMSKAWGVLWVGGASLGTATGWIEALVADPDPHGSGLLLLLLARRIPSGGVDEDVVATRAEWLSLAEVGPWAYAAGLTFAEARQALADGTVDRDALEMLAVLRGWRFPALDYELPPVALVPVATPVAVAPSRRRALLRWVRSLLR